MLDHNENKKNNEFVKETKYWKSAFKANYEKTSFLITVVYRSPNSKEEIYEECCYIIV